MLVQVHLYGILRDLLPPEAKGRATITLEDGAKVRDLLAHLGVQRRVLVAVNDLAKVDRDFLLHEGDRVIIYTMIGGG